MRSRIKRIKQAVGFERVPVLACKHLVSGTVELNVRWNSLSGALSDKSEIFGRLAALERSHGERTGTGARVHELNSVAGDCQPSRDCRRAGVIYRIVVDAVDHILDRLGACQIDPQLRAVASHDEQIVPKHVRPPETT